MASPRPCGLDMVVIALIMAALISTGLGLGCPIQMPHLKLKVDRRAMFDVWCLMYKIWPMMSLNRNVINEFTLQWSHTLNPSNTMSSEPTSEKVMESKRIHPWTQRVSQTLVAEALIVYN